MQCEVTGSGRPLVLVPGGLTGWASWEPFVNMFSDKRTVIRVQLIGVQFGSQNRPLPEGYSVKTEISALAATLDSLGYNMPVNVVAWSFGAFTSLDYALDFVQQINRNLLAVDVQLKVLLWKQKDISFVLDLFKSSGIYSFTDAWKQ